MRPGATTRPSAGQDGAMSRGRGGRLRGAAVGLAMLLASSGSRARRATPSPAVACSTSPAPTSPPPPRPDPRARRPRPRRPVRPRARHGRHPAPPASGPSRAATRPTTGQRAPGARAPLPAERPRQVPAPGPELLGPGDAGAEVRELQSRLRQVAWFVGDVTDDYGSTTEPRCAGSRPSAASPSRGTSTSGPSTGCGDDPRAHHRRARQPVPRRRRHLRRARRRAA